MSICISVWRVKGWRTDHCLLSPFFWGGCFFFCLDNFVFIYIDLWLFFVLHFVIFLNVHILCQVARLCLDWIMPFKRYCAGRYTTSDREACDLCFPPRKCHDLQAEEVIPWRYMTRFSMFLSICCYTISFDIMISFVYICVAKMGNSRTFSDLLQETLLVIHSFSQF